MSADTADTACHPHKNHLFQQLECWHTSCLSAVTPPSQPIMIRDTSAQDQVLRAPARSTQWR
ncbi:efflux transporter periplasmic adaptor subunit, partial [Xanthomonas oryzae pv. oryzae]